MLPHLERANRIGEFWGIRRRAPSPRLLIDCEEDRTPPSGAREQREEPFGSKRWHWPAVAFLGFLVIVSILLLRFAEDPR